MMAKKSANADRKTSANVSSPYHCSTQVLLFSGSSKEYRVHDEILDRHEKLKSSKAATLGWGRPINLNDVDEDIAHTFIHYLYTGVYDTLEIPEEPESNCFVELERALKVRKAAKDYELLELQTLAEEEFQSLHESLTAYELLDAVSNMDHSLTSEDGCFGSDFSDKIQQEYANIDALVATDRFMMYFGRRSALDAVLLRCIVSTLTTEITNLKSARAAHDESVKPPTPPIEPDVVSLPENATLEEQGVPAEDNRAMEEEPIICEDKNESDDHPPTPPPPPPPPELEYPEPPFEEPVPEEPIPEVTPESAVIAEDEDNLWEPLKKQKEKKKANLEPVPEPELVLEDEDEWGSWGSLKKQKKKTKGNPQPFPDPEPVPEPEPEDEWGSSWGSSKKQKKKKKGNPEPFPEPFPEPEPFPDPEPVRELEDDWGLGWGSLKKEKKKKKGKSEPAPWIATEAIPHEAGCCEDGIAVSSPCEEIPMPPEEVFEEPCPEQARHLNNSYWKGCPKCLSFVQQVTDVLGVKRSKILSASRDW